MKKTIAYLACIVALISPSYFCSDVYSQNFVLLPGDINLPSDDRVDHEDIDEITRNIGNPIINSRLDRMDVDRDGAITLNDRQLVIEEFADTPHGRGTFSGDINLDGEVDVIEDESVPRSKMDVVLLIDTSASWIANGRRMAGDQRTGCNLFVTEYAPTSSGRRLACMKFSDDPFTFQPFLTPGFRYSTIGTNTLRFPPTNFATTAENPVQLNESSGTRRIIHQAIEDLEVNHIPTTTAFHLNPEGLVPPPSQLADCTLVVRDLEPTNIPFWFNECLIERGSTDTGRALFAASDLLTALDDHVPEREEAPNVVVIVTDGLPTLDGVGIVNEPGNDLADEIVQRALLNAAGEVMSEDGTEIYVVNYSARSAAVDDFYRGVGLDPSVVDVPVDTHYIPVESREEFFEAMSQLGRDLRNR